MRFSFKIALFALVIALAAGELISARAEDKVPPAFTDAQKAEINGLIQSYIAEHPEAIVGALQAFQEKQQEEATKSSELKISENKAALTAEGLPGAGNPKGDVTVVEFFDYNCGYCKKAIEDIKSILESDKNVRFVFFDMPILGPSSLTASLWAHAAHEQGKYFEYHTALMEHSGGLDENTLAEIAKNIGLDVEKMKKDAASEKTQASVKKSMEIGRELGIQGTPGFIVGDQLFPGYLGPDGLKKAIEDARGGKKS